MKDNRREFIKKGSAMAALSLAGINIGRDKITGLADDLEQFHREGGRM
ncbi:MAG: hypothetical protein IPJ37_06560 [Bacteroidales bacterium]|nr:hypothetical protein [Bacteroidales bacterium]